MKLLRISRPFVGLVLLLMTIQLACNIGSPAPTSIPPTSAPAASQSPQSTEPVVPTSSGGNGSAADAQAMLNQAVQHYQTVGREQALKDFTDKKPPFNSGDLYIVCIGSDHKVSAMGAFPLLVGSSADSLQDPNGQPVGKLIWDAASAVPQGSVPFHWTNPLTGQAESKILVYQKLDQDVCGVPANQP